MATPELSGKMPLARLALFQREVTGRMTHGGLPDTIEHVTAIAGASPSAYSDRSWGDILQTWIRFSWAIILASIVCAAVGFTVARTMAPVYATDSVVLLDRPHAGKLDNAADPPTYDPDQRATLLRSQVEILRSRRIIASVIQNLRLDTLPMFNPKPGTLAALRARIMDELGRVFPALASAPQPAEFGMARIEDIYLDHLSIQLSPDTYVIHVGFSASDPVLAANVANAQVAAYVAWLQSESTDAIAVTEGWLQSEVVTARTRVTRAEAAIRDFGSRGVLLNVDGRTALDQGLAQLTTDLAVAQTNLVKASAHASEVDRLNAAGQIAGIIAMADSRVLDALQTDFARAAADAAALDAARGSNHPDTRRAQARIGDIRTAINRQIDHYVQGVHAQADIAHATLSNLQTALDNTRTQVVAAEVDRAQLTRLEGEAATERNIYLALLQKLRSYAGVTQLVQPAVTVLSPAQPPLVPRGPRPMLLVLFGGIVGAGVAACSVVWIVGRQNVVRHTYDATSLTGMRCLATMPKLRMREHVPDRHQASYGFFREELRALCATLVRDRDDEPGQHQAVSLLLTSCLPGEGKTTFCHELGRFAAENDIPTLIVHTDERSPERRSAFGPDVPPVPVEAGLPLYRVDWVPPATTLAGHDLVGTIRAWQREFGLLIFDTAPTTARAESLILTPFVDATIILARVDGTPRSLLAGVAAQVGNAGGRLAGVILTFVSLDTQRGVMPSDPGYWFNRNRAYHVGVATARASLRT